MIPIFKPVFGARCMKAIETVLDTGMLACGKMVRELEEEFAKYVGFKYAVGVNSCTSALLLAYHRYEGTEIKIPSVTFASVVNMAMFSGLDIEFTDIVMVGSAYHLEPTLIYDCAHEIERNMYGRSSIATACYSFYPTKNLGSAEGGMICTNNKDDYEYYLKMRNHGMIREGYEWDYTIETEGWKCSMNEIQAAIALVKLDELDEELEKRRQVVNWYNDRLEYANNSLHVYPVLIKDRDKLMKELKKNEIGYSVHFKPNHLQPAYKFWVNEDDVFTKSEFWGNYEISLPLYPSLKESEVDEVCKIVKKYL